MICQYIQLRMIIEGNTEAQRDIRLRFAFWGEEPDRYGCEDDDYEADEDAPATVRKQLATLSF